MRLAISDGVLSTLWEGHMSSSENSSGKLLAVILGIIGGIVGLVTLLIVFISIGTWKGNVTTTIDGLSTNVSVLTQRVTGVEEKVGDLAKNIARMEEKVNGLAEKMDKSGKQQAQLVNNLLLIATAEQVGDVTNSSDFWKITEQGERVLPEKFRVAVQKIIGSNSGATDDDVLIGLYKMFPQTELVSIARSSKRSLQQMLGLVLVYAGTLRQ